LRPTRNLLAETGFFISILSGDIVENESQGNPPSTSQSNQGDKQAVASTTQSTPTQPTISQLSAQPESVKLSETPVTVVTLRDLSPMPESIIKVTLPGSLKK
jgi:hypothetical protein